ncbi:hypothetical protein GCK72_015065 [Caenorhabditis remanei]|uniref:Bestrophin homolog n=2 Tax=Caenorhabditis remanei TaxID=31234 RepID=A0A6A5GVH5_CAERE|nr:hypothetical protein GCK72_015065 [Caenorhabditis remanei]KAF1758606.1 hypothetical protein GCK72_015065 [Caenorhabditis remanei]
MTVSYNSDVSSVSSTNFLRLLLRWKGSIWKSVSSELLIWCSFYLAIAVVYHYFLFPNGYYDAFNDVAYYCGKELHNYIPLTFMLAFFVSIIVERWRTVFVNMGWIESVALTLNTVIISRCEEARLIRRNIVRYLVLAQILTFRDISIRVRRRFPNIDTIKKAGFMTVAEEKMLEDLELSYNKYWVPVNWCVTLTNQASAKGYTSSPPGLVHLIQEIKNFRNGLATLCNYDWCPIPIAYPQVVFFAVRVYFIFCLISRQYIRVPNKDFESVQLFIRPFITIIEFICIVGWMKVAEALLNPLGEDDDDFESNFLIDKNIFTGMKIVDCFDEVPPLVEDTFSDPGAVPIYSEDSQRNYQNGALVGSVSNVTLAQFDENITMVPVAPRLSVGDIHSHDRPSIRRRYRSGNASQTVSRASSFREPRLQRQSSEGERNDAYEMDHEPYLEEPSSPTKHAKFFTNLTKVDENDDEDLPATAKTSVVSRV